jgi:2-polyprenyl-3-methyl-5-hydroxy-6-metoxy-1,4-benzoquinol methylase
MEIDPLSDAKIIDSWNKNATPWTTAVRTGQIESRQLSTDQAIVNAVLTRSPRSVLDIGCGEGWLARVLEAKGIRVTGVDVVPGLIEQAQGAGAGTFRAVSYEEIAAGKLQISVDVIVCNFALLGKESVEGLFGVIPSLLNPHGSFVFQTLHPVAACGDYPYQDGWRGGSWEGFAPEFTDPAPWYFRTLGSWVTLVIENRLRLLEMREPLHTKTKQPASVIFIAARTD